jgi:leader peptidase (prepilin peptidase)/N-methyltransferase
VIIVIIALSLCWGSFLNMLSYRLTHDMSFGGRSQCIHCAHTIAVRDLIPVFSWLWLKGACRWCSKPISPLYPFIELLTTLIFLSAYFYLPVDYWPAYFIFFSALIVTIRSDLECMLISRFATLYLIPLALILSLCGLAPVSPLESIIGACAGYGFLWGTAKLFTIFTGKHGMGQGDLDLLAFIGACTGIIGCWVSILAGSISGSVLGLGYLGYQKFSARFYAKPLSSLPASSGFASVKIPFGPFLALGALIFVFFQQQITALLLGELVILWP